MAGIWKHPRSKYWTACFRDQHGRQRRVSTKETDRKRAKRIAEEFEKAARTKRTLRQAQIVLDRLHEELSGEQVSRKSLRSFSKDWLAAKGPETTSRTLAFYRATAEKLIAFLGAKADGPLNEISQADLIAYRNSLAETLTGGTVNHHLTALRTLFKAARRAGVLTENPAEFIGAVRTRTQHFRRPFTIPEIQSVLSVADPEWQSLIKFGFYTGQRLGDLAGLRWSNIDLARDELRLVTAKTGKRMLLPISEGLRTHIESLPCPDDLDSPLHPRAARIVKEQNRSSTLSRQFGELLSQAGLKEKRPHRNRGVGRSARREVSSLSFHCLRRTATTLLHEYGVAGAVAQALIGHDSAQTHEDYISVGREALRKAAAVLPTI